MQDSQFGQIGGQPVPLFTIASPGGHIAALTPFGARLVQLWLADRQGRRADVVLGHDRLQDYLDHPTFAGATCGRYANRIRAGNFLLDGKPVQLDCNEGANHLHGGRHGFDKKLWAIADRGPAHVTFTARSGAGEMGFPGACDLTSTYRFTDDDRLLIEMGATTDAPTLMNMVNHAYFNLGGQGSGPVTGHHMRVAAGFYTPVTPDLLTTGEIRAVEGTAFDFLDERPLAEALAAPLAPATGYDHNWCLAGEPAGPGLHLCAEVVDPVSGRGLRLATDQPGVQIYTCGMMPDGVPGKAGATYGHFAALTLETQAFPCSPNHPHFPQARLDPGQTYRHRMEFTFFTR